MTPRTWAKLIAALAVAAYAVVTADVLLWSDAVWSPVRTDALAIGFLVVFTAAVLAGQAWWPRLFPDVESGRHAAGRQP